MDLSYVDNARVFTVRIPPKGRIAVPACRTLALVDGDAPSVSVFSSKNNEHRLYLGQCLPVDLNCTIVNPYQRTLTVSYGVNFMPTIGSASHYQELNPATGAVTYHLSQVLDDLGDGKRKGVGFLQKKGASWITTKSWANTLITVIPKASMGFMEAKPVDAMALEPLARHMSDDVNENLQVISGYYSDAEFAAWISAAGYSGNMFAVAKDSSGWRGFIEEGSAVFITTDAGKDYKVEMKILDMGSSDD